MKWLRFAGKQEDFTTWECPIHCLYSDKKNVWKLDSQSSWTIVDAPKSEQHEAHRVATDEFENNRKKFRDDEILVWCMLASTVGANPT